MPRENTIETRRSSLTPSTPHSSASSIVPIYRQPSHMIRSNASPSHVRSLELKLMHSFTALTANTLSHVPSQQNAWQVEIPTIAYEYTCLMDAILAVSALHLRSLHPQDQSLVRASHAYMASALAQYSNLLALGSSEQNAEALFSTSALIAFQASAARRFEIDSDNQNYTLPLAWFHSFQGVKTIVMASWQWLRNSTKVFPIISGQPPLALDMDLDERSFFAPILEGLDTQLELLPETQRYETRKAYEHSIAFLNWAHRKPDRARILSFAATVSRRFVELMSGHDPRALVIVACFFAMTRKVDEIWWLRGVPKREVMGILSLLPEEWWPKMQWAITVANCEGEISESIWGVSWTVGGRKRLEEEERLEREMDVTKHIDLLTQIMAAEAPAVD